MLRGTEASVLPAAPAGPFGARAASRNPQAKLIPWAEIRPASPLRPLLLTSLNLVLSACIHTIYQKQA